MGSDALSLDPGAQWHARCRHPPGLRALQRHQDQLPDRRRRRGAAHVEPDARARSAQHKRARVGGRELGADLAAVWSLQSAARARLTPRGRRPVRDARSRYARGASDHAGPRGEFVDPRTGGVRERLAVRGQFDVLSHNLALAGTTTGMADPLPLRNSLTLVNLSTGARTHLRWPSVLHSQSGYSVIPEPHGPLVALDFADPAYHMTGRQVSDVWILDPRTGKLTHVPGFPILEALKFSGLTWAPDGRLVVAAEGLRHTAIGLWRPGSTHLQVGRLPRLAGYTQLVALGR